MMVMIRSRLRFLLTLSGIFVAANIKKPLGFSSQRFFSMYQMLSVFQSVSHGFDITDS
jgi:hypothetical protein